VVLSVEDGRSINMDARAWVDALMSLAVSFSSASTLALTSFSGGVLVPCFWLHSNAAASQHFPRPVAVGGRGLRRHSASSHGCSFSACRAPAQLAHASSLCTAAYPSLKRLRARC
jgi:hypothetical protein